MQFYNWILGCVLIYATLFGIGKLIFKEWASRTGIHRGCAIVAAALISRNLSQADWKEHGSERIATANSISAWILCKQCQAFDQRLEFGPIAAPLRPGREDVANQSAFGLMGIAHRE